MYGFSFERGFGNTTTGSLEQGISAASVQDSTVARVQNAGMYLICGMLMFPLVRSIGEEFRRDILILALLLWVLVSAAWSDDASASVTNGIRMSLDVALAFYLCKRYESNDLLKILMLVGSVAAVGSIVLIFIFPQYGLQNRDPLYAFGAWQGIFGHKNICGSVMALLLLPAFFVQLDSRPKRKFRILYIIVLVIIIGMTRSTGAWILCGSSMVFILTMRLLVKLNRKDSWTVGAMLLGVSVVVSCWIASDPGAFLRIMGKDPGMHGRTAIWTSLMVAGWQHPLVGYGYRAFWRGLSGGSAVPILQLKWTGIGYAENGVLELWLELGAIGVLLYGMVFLRAAVDAVYCLHRSPSAETMWYSTVLLYTVIGNLWGGNLLLPSYLQCVLPFVAFVGLRREACRSRSPAFS